MEEASYQAYLHNLMLKEGAQDEEVLDMTVIDNRQKGFSSTFDSNQEVSFKEKRNQKGVQKKKR
jgi:hypothetical protein